MTENAAAAVESPMPGTTDCTICDGPMRRLWPSNGCLGYGHRIVIRWRCLVLILFGSLHVRKALLSQIDAGRPSNGRSYESDGE